MVSQGLRHAAKGGQLYRPSDESHSKEKKVTNQRPTSRYQTLSQSHEEELFELSQNILMPYLYLTSLTLAHVGGVMTPQARRHTSLHTNHTLISPDKATLRGK